VVKRIKKYRGVYKESNKRNGEKQRRWIKKRRKDNSLERISICSRFSYSSRTDNLRLP